MDAIPQVCEFFRAGVSQLVIKVDVLDIEIECEVAGLTGLAIEVG